MSTLIDAGSPHNLVALKDAGAIAERRVDILDLTLEGDCEEMAGVRLSHSDRSNIAKRLDALGVARMAVLGNSPTPSREELASAEEIAGLGLRSQLCSFVKTPFEIDMTAQIGLWGVVILIGVNEKFFAPNQSGQDVIDAARQMSEQAKQLDLHCALMAMDATRANPDYVKSFMEACEPTVDEFVICDSIGVASPWGFERLVRLAKTWTKRPLQVHCHNHTGVGVANVLAAIHGGADVVHTCVNGWGEFAGQPALEEVAVAMEMHLGVRSNLALEQLTELSNQVAHAAGMPLLPNKPITGAGAFAIPETEEIQKAFGLAAQAGVLDNALTFPPRLVGNQAQMSIGRKCSRYTIIHALAERGLIADDGVIDQIVAAVRGASAAHEGYFLMDGASFDRLLTAGMFATRPLKRS